MANPSFRSDSGHQLSEAGATTQRQWPSTPKTKSPVDGVWLARYLNPKFYTYIDRFDRHPTVTATIDQAHTVEVARESNPHFMLSGNNAVDGDVTRLAHGGIRMQTVGADGDEDILGPHTDGTPLNQDWNPTNRPLFYANIVSGPLAADVTNFILWGGLKLTSTEVTVTDADQAFFRAENGVNGGRWQAITSIGGTDTAIDTGVLGLNAAVTLATNYRLLVEVGADRRPRFYINDVRVSTGGVMTAAADLEPYLGVAADGAAEAKILDVRNILVSRLY